MSFKNLTDNVNDQEGVVGKLYQRTGPETDAYIAWEKFRDSVWGKGLEISQEAEAVERDGSIPVEDVVLPKDHTVATLPHGLIPKTSKILVRSEYYEAEEEAVLSSKRYNAFVVSGQPGIGKSTFLQWLLMRRLALKLPTVLQIYHSYAILFHKDGILELTRLGDRMSYLALEGLSSPIWALIDSDLEPAPVFKYQSPFFLVYMMPLHSKHLGWLDKLAPRMFYMTPWSISEVLQARPFFQNKPTERQLKEFYYEFGASPRALAEYSICSDQYEALLQKTINQIQPGQLRMAFHDPGVHNFSHYVTTMWPTHDHCYYRVEFAARRVARLVWEKHAHSQIDDMEDFYQLFCGGKVLSTSATWIFEFRMHELLRNGQTIELFPILRSPNKGMAGLVYDNYAASRNGKDPVNLTLPVSSEYPLTEGVRLEEGRYYRPKSSDFVVDSLLLIHPPGESPILLMFQMAPNNSERDVSPKGLDIIDRMSPGARKYFVVVTPETVYPKVNIPTKCFKETRGQVAFADEALPVFHYFVCLEGLFTKNP